jgi:hypothetical protein
VLNHIFILFMLSSYVLLQLLKESMKFKAVGVIQVLKCWQEAQCERVDCLCLKCLSIISFQQPAKTAVSVCVQNV